LFSISYRKYLNYRALYHLAVAWFKRWHISSYQGRYAVDDFNLSS